MYLASLTHIGLALWCFLLSHAPCGPCGLHLRRTCHVAFCASYIEEPWCNLSNLLVIFYIVPSHVPDFHRSGMIWSNHDFLFPLTQLKGEPIPDRRLNETSFVDASFGLQDRRDDAERVPACG